MQIGNFVNAGKGPFGAFFHEGNIGLQIIGHEKSNSYTSVAFVVNAFRA
jgi:hypothetical protein